MRFFDRSELAGTARDVHTIGADSLWVAPPGSRFAVEATEPLRLAYVFHPPITGVETGIVKP
jgi:hypothetical protein